MPRNGDGIQLRHTKRCAKTRNASSRCSCTPSYRVRVDVPAAGGRARVTKTFQSKVDAEAWRYDALREVRNGLRHDARPVKFREAADEFLDGIRTGTIRNRSGDRYKPSTVAGYEQAFKLRLTPDFGARDLATIKRGDLARAVERWQRSGLDASTIRNTINAARAMYRRAIEHEIVTTNPTAGLSLPAVTGKRDRIAPPDELAALLEALPRVSDRALCGLAGYAGLRLGEILGLRWGDVDLEARRIDVRRSWCHKSFTTVAPKSMAGTRRVPMSRALHRSLAAHELASARTGGEDLVFPGAKTGRPESFSGLYERLTRAWTNAELVPIHPHELRHTYATLMIAAGCNAKQLATWMGHSTIVITLDRYGHLFPGAERDGADMLDRFLSSALAT